MDWLFAYADPSIDWEYAMVTLVVRFVGVFLVMFTIQAAMQAASWGVNRFEAGNKAKKAATPAARPVVSSLDISAVAEHGADLDQETVAVIGLALAMEAEQQSAGTRAASGGGSSAWAMAGRLRGMR